MATVPYVASRAAYRGSGWCIDDSSVPRARASTFSRTWSTLSAGAVEGAGARSRPARDLLTSISYGHDRKRSTCVNTHCSPDCPGYALDHPLPGHLRRAAAGAARRPARTRRPGRGRGPAIPAASREPQRTGPLQLPARDPGWRQPAPAARPGHGQTGRRGRERELTGPVPGPAPRMPRGEASPALGRPVKR